MKRLLILVAAVAATGLIVWLASGITSEEPVADKIEATHVPSRPPPAPVEPHGFSTEPAPGQKELPQSQPEKPAAIQAARAVPEGGMVVRASDGSPLDAVVVRALAVDAQHGEVELARTTTRAGRFDFGLDVTSRGPSSLQFSWTAPTPKGVKQARPRVVEDRVELAQVQGRLDQIQVTLDTGWMVRGRVVDDAGKPVASVAIERVGGTGAASDGNGDFQLRDIAPEERSVTLKFMSRGHKTVTLDAAPAGGGKLAELAVTLPAAGSPK